MDNATQSAMLLALLPILAVIGLSLNLFIRARGGRSFVMRLRGFGIDLTVESNDAHARVHKEQQHVEKD